MGWQQNYKTCVTCGVSFPARPSSMKTTCSKECSKIRRSKAQTKDMIGIRPEGSRLIVLELVEIVEGRGGRYLCQCDCGNTVIVRGDSLRSGETKSCGCIRDELLQDNVKTAYLNMFVESTNIPKIKSKQPQRNNSSGIRGVSWHKGIGKWQARITFQKKKYSLGYFTDIKDAAEVRRQAEERIFGEFLEWYNKKKGNV